MSYPFAVFQRGYFATEIFNFSSPIPSNPPNKVCTIIIVLEVASVQMQKIYSQ